MRKYYLWAFFLVLFSLPLSAFGNSGNLALIEEGVVKSIIIEPANADENEKLAVTELIDHLEKITGVRLQTITATSSQMNAKLGEALGRGLAPIIIGSIGLDSGLKTEILKQGDDPAAFAILVDGLMVKIAGLSSEGTLFGVYDLLEQIGCRWFMPGELGIVIPDLKTVAVKQQKTIQVPSFTGRWHSVPNAQTWQRRVRMGGPYFPGAHGLKWLKRDMIDTHPEYFSLVNGERTTRQACLSNPEVLKHTIEYVKDYFRKNPDEIWCALGPNDGSGFCECDNCQALDGDDWDPFASQKSVTDRYIWFFNQVLAGIEDEFPDKKIAFYAYHAYMRPPVRYKPNPKIVPAFAPITLCRVHGMSNPICPERSYYETIMKEWGEILPDLYERGYWFNLADPGFPFSQVHKMRDEIPKAKELGITGWRVEALGHWASETPSLYLAAKLMWDHTLDVDALLKDFYEKFFGPAEKPMSEYLELMDAALKDSDHHTGCSFDMPYFYPQELRDKARKLLNDALELAGDGIYGARVQLFRESFSYLEHFISMLENNKRFDFVAAKADLEQIDLLREKLTTGYDIEMLRARSAESYMRRFFRQTTEHAYERVTGGSKLIVGLSDEWDFLLDPASNGEAIGLWKKDVKGGNWQKIKASLSWSNQGLRYYKGDAWYRQKVMIPAPPEGVKLYLWFGGIDEAAKVWVNGKEVGVRQGSAFLPFDFEITDVVEGDAENTITVKVTNHNLDELGTGGIVYPVMIYAASEDSKLGDVDDIWAGRDPILY